MAIKRILLPFCDNGDVKPIAEAAFHVGQLLAAQVRGLFAQRPYSFPPSVGEPLSPEMIQLLVEHEQRTRAETFRRVQEMFQDLEARFPHVDAEWVAADGSIRDLVSRSAWLADISILAVVRHSRRTAGRRSARQHSLEAVARFCSSRRQALRRGVSKQS